MPATLTKESMRVAVGMRAAARLRSARQRRCGLPRGTVAGVRTRITEDGMFVGRSVLVLPFDL